MKNNRLNIFRSSILRVLATTAVCAGALVTNVSALTYYWDGNGDTTGAGSNANVAGNWADAKWSQSSVGTDPTTAPAITSADTVVFTAHDGVPANNPSGGYAVTLSSAQSVAGIVIGAPLTPAASGGTPTLTGTGSPGISIGADGVILNGSNGDPVFHTNLGTVTLAADQTWTINNAKVWAIQAPVAGNAAAASTRTWTLGYVNAYTPNYSGVISDGSAGGKLALTLDNTNGVSTGGGTTYLSGTNSSYTGKTTIKRGILQVRSMANAGLNSSLGAPVGSDSIIDIGSADNLATLRYNGASASSSDRVINLAGTTTTGTGITILNDSSLANTLTLTGGVTNAGGGNKTLTLRGSNAGANTIGVISDAGDLSTTKVSKLDAGSWFLSGNNTFTGGVAITGGSLTFSAPSNSFDGPITVSGSTSLLTFNGSNSFTQGMSVTGGTVIVGASGALGQDVSGNNITVNGGNLQFNADSGFTNANRSITILSGGIGIGPGGVLPTYIDSTPSGVILGLNLVGDAGITGLTGGSFLGSFTGGTFTGGSLTPGATSTYRLGGGGGLLVIQNNVLVGANNLLAGTPTSGGAVTLSNGNTFTGTTTVQNGILNVSSINSVSGGTASSSLGTPTTVGNGTISLGYLANAVSLNYTGAGETTDRVLNFSGTTGTVTLGNSGSGTVHYTSTPTFTGAGARTIQLGATTDTNGGSLSGLGDQDGATGKTSVSKAGLTNSTWAISGNTFTGTTKIDGGVLEVSLPSLASTYINLDGDSQTQYAVLQTSGTLARTLGTAAGEIRVGVNSGFAAKGGSLTVTLNAGADLSWGGANFLGSGPDRLVFGSTTADSQVIFTNAINLNTTDAFQRQFYVEQGVGGDSALLSGVLSFGLDGMSNPAPSGLSKIGPGTLILGAANTYFGTTTVGAGTLLVNGSTSTGPVQVNASATLGGTGTIGGDVTVLSSGVMAPGASIGTLNASGNVTLNPSSTFAVELNASNADRLNVAGTLTITNSILDITELATPTAPAYVIASYTGTLGGDFANVFGMPDGYELQTDYAGGTQIAIVQTGASTPYDDWAELYSLSGDDALTDADPDFDGVENIIEFALNGDPTDGASNGLLFARMATVSAAPNVLTLTIAVREDAVFAADGNRQTATVDGITYTVEAANNLVDWGAPVVTEVTGGDASTIQGEFDTPDTGWIYKTFRTDGSSASDASDFIRVSVE